MIEAAATPQSSPLPKALDAVQRLTSERMLQSHLQTARVSILGDADASQLAEFFGVKEGVLVRSVVKGSAAEKAGLKAGDVITKVDETRVSTPREISSAIRTATSKSTVTVQLVREKREMSLTMSIDDRSDLPQAAPRRSLRK